MRGRFLVVVQRAASTQQRKVLAQSAQVLGVAESASATEIKAAFRKAALVRRAHPDLAAEGDKAGAAREFLRLREAAAALLDPSSIEEEEQSSFRRWGSGSAAYRQREERAVVRRRVYESLEAELMAAVHTMRHGPDLLVDEEDRFPAWLEMEEVNVLSSKQRHQSPRRQREPLLRLTYGSQQVGLVTNEEDELRLSLFEGSVTATARRRQRCSSFFETEIRRENKKNSEPTFFVSPKNRGFAFCGFGDFREHTLYHKNNPTHRVFEYVTPGVHAMVWKRVVPRHHIAGTLGLLMDPSPVVATVTKAYFPHKVFWPAFFSDFRPDTHASDGISNAFYLERLATTSPRFVDPFLKSIDSAIPVFPPPRAIARRKKWQRPFKHHDDCPLDPVCCVFAAAFHTLDQQRKRAN